MHIDVDDDEPDRRGKAPATVPGRPQSCDSTSHGGKQYGWLDRVN